ncbi:MAG: hypothetical protein IK078_06765 [Lachnospiraceae bacterium]|nr:hypothetical protein [Lachnospiraceae bacterium]
MGLFDKLLDGLGVDSQTVGKFVDGLVDSAKEQNARRETESSYSVPVEPASGDSWGEVMPQEENQYNYNGTYIQYFENIFEIEFSDYEYEKEDLEGTYRTVYTFYSGGSKVLVLELMNEGSTARKIRNEAERERIPYLRFYYDHDGWWNTRSYVTRRMREALN